NEALSSAAASFEITSCARAGVEATVSARPAATAAAMKRHFMSSSFVKETAKSVLRLRRAKTANPFRLATSRAARDRTPFANEHAACPGARHVPDTTTGGPL